MKALHNLLVNLFHRNASIIICPCGYKATSEVKALKHLSRHSNKMGGIDFGSGAVSW